MKLKQIALATAALLATSSALAADVKTGLSGSGELGFNSSTGNTVSESLFAGLKLDYLQKTYKVKGLVEAVNKKESNVQTAERYVGDFQADLYFNDTQKMYGFGQARWENDRFADLDLSSYYLVGLGYNYFQETDIVLGVEAGAGYQDVNYLKADNFGQAVAKLYGNFEYAINDNVRFLQDLTEYYGTEQAKFESNTGLRVKLADNLKMKVAYKYRHNSAPAAGKKAEDTETLLSVMYDF